MTLAHGSHSGGHEELYLLGYNSIESQPTFQESILPPFSGLRCLFLALITL
jgi:hypothetical protein